MLLWFTGGRFYFLPHATFNRVSPRPIRVGIHVAVEKREVFMCKTSPLPI